MGRMTRKKVADLAESLHVEEDALLDASTENAVRDAKAYTPEPTDRAPLGELEPNSADSKTPSEDATQELKKSTQGKKGGKKGGAKKKNLAASAGPHLEYNNGQQEVLPDENDSAPLPASEKAAEDLMKDVPECKFVEVK